MTTTDQGITCKHGLPHGHPCSQCGAEAIASRTSNDRSPTVTEDGAIVRTAADVLSSPSRQKAAATVAASNPVLAKWGKHRLACPPQCIECEMRAEIERLARELNDAQGNLRVAWGQRDDQERTWIKTRDESERRRAALEAVRAAFDGGRPGLFCRLDMLRDAEPLVRAALSGEPGSGHETTASPQAPIVRVVIENGKAAYTTIYAPGLPDGTHDLYCEPEAVAPMMRAEAHETRGECPVCLGERRVTIGRRAIGQDSRIKALQMMYVEQPCPMCNAQKANERCPSCDAAALDGKIMHKPGCAQSWYGSATNGDGCNNG